MKLFITLMLIAMLRSALAQRVQFGLLVCEDGPVIFRQTTTPGVRFGVEGFSQTQCTPGQSPVCEGALGLASGHSGLVMCAVNRDCGAGERVCLRRFFGNSSTIVACCKVAQEAWALSGAQESSAQPLRLA